MHNSQTDAFDRLGTPGLKMISKSHDVITQYISRLTVRAIARVITSDFIDSLSHPDVLKGQDILAQGRRAVGGLPWVT